MNRKPLIAFLGASGFPLGFAAIQRLTLLARALDSSGCEVVVICRKGVWDRSSGNGDLFGLRGNHQGINYVYTSKSVYKPKGFFNRNIQKAVGIYREFRYLKSLKKDHQLDAAVISSMSSLHVLRYRVFSLLLNFPIALNLVELSSAMMDRNTLRLKANDYVFDHFVLKFMDGALPISTKLQHYFRGVAPKKPSLKIPIICDFEEFDIKTPTSKETVFLYCGSAAYSELIHFIVEAFELLAPENDGLLLNLIIGGSRADLDNIRGLIADYRCRDRVRIFNNIPREQIPVMYSEASALLIPLRPTVQDEARFPHKIGEYLASGTPIITTAYGEINHYPFHDQQNALIAEKYDWGQFSAKMKYVVDNPIEARNIGLKGRDMGRRTFHFTHFGSPLRDFLLEL